MHEEKRIDIDPCPNCGKDHGATQCNHEWGHNIMCCSDFCGIAVKEKIEKNESTLEFKTALRQYHQLKIRLHEIRYRRIHTTDPFYTF